MNVRKKAKIYIKQQDELNNVAGNSKEIVAGKANGKENVAGKDFLFISAFYFQFLEAQK